jgi:IclR family acetate operon transcriptional repressor
MVADDNQRTVATIDRALDVLVLLGQTDTLDLGVTEIAKSIGLSKAVVHRTLTTLVSKRFVSVDPTTRRYRIGPAVLALGAAYSSRIDVRRMALPYLHELCEATDETATLSVRHEWTRNYVEQITPAREVKMTVQIGASFPLHAGGSSKAFLAFLPEDEIEKYLKDSGLSALTEHTITNPHALRRELSRIRELGYATSDGERQPGSVSVAAPIFDQSGQVAAVMSVCGPAERMRDERDQCAKMLLKAAGELSSELGYDIRLLSVG